MPLFDEKTAELKAVFGELKTNIAGLKSALAQEKARADAAEKKLAATAASSISSDAFGSWAVSFIEEIKGANP